MSSRTALILFLTILEYTNFHQAAGQGVNRSNNHFLASVSVSIDPTKATTKCSGEDQKIVCQIIDYDGQLPKMMKLDQNTKGYGGYVEYLLFKRTTAKTAAPGSNVGENVVADLRVNYPGELLQPRELMLSNLTVFDKGDYNCTVIWHGISGDNRWSSSSLPLNVYDCIDLEKEQIEANIGDTITMQCIDVEAPIKWFKDDEKLDTDDTQITATPSATTVQPRLKGVPGVRTISIRSVDDAGVYTCKATFEDTQQIFTKHNEVRIKTAPTTPINITPHRLAPTSVVLRWDQKPVPNRYIVADPTFYTVFYRAVESEMFMSKTVLKNPEVMLTNLKPSTVYFVRIQAENELGTSVSGSRIVVTPAASDIVTIDKRLLQVMSEHVKVLDQDLESIANVLQGIVEQVKSDDETTEVSPAPATTRPPGSAPSRSKAAANRNAVGRKRRFFQAGRQTKKNVETKESGKFILG